MSRAPEEIHVFINDSGEVALACYDADLTKYVRADVNEVCLALVREQQIEIDRSRELLKATLDSLQYQASANYVTNLFNGQTVHYDQADCDGICLMDDIRFHLGLSDE